MEEGDDRLLDRPIMHTPLLTGLLLAMLIDATEVVWKGSRGEFGWSGVEILTSGVVADMPGHRASQRFQHA
jgi:hypothetical protein